MEIVTSIRGDNKKKGAVCLPRSYLQFDSQRAVKNNISPAPGCRGWCTDVQMGGSQERGGTRTPYAHSAPSSASGMLIFPKLLLLEVVVEK